MKAAVVDYGLGNLASVCRAVAALGGEPFIAERPEQLRAADCAIVPGVGSFALGMVQLDARGWTAALRDLVANGTRPLLGICLGMQVLAARGTEGGDVTGLGLLPGRILRLDALGCTLRLPHVGWNSLRQRADTPPVALLNGVPDGADFYFVHSYGWHAEDEAVVRAHVEYGVRVPAVVGEGLVWGTQFHPEKSSRAGLRVLENFLGLARC